MDPNEFALNWKLFWQIFILMTWGFLWIAVLTGSK